MRIYVSHSRSFDFRKNLYQPLAAVLGEHELIFPHANSKEPFPSRQLFEEKGCDIVLAEVSFPSTGLGIELGWASFAGIPIYSIRQVGANHSASVAAVSKFDLEYQDSRDLGEVVANLIKRIASGLA